MWKPLSGKSKEKMIFDSPVTKIGNYGKKTGRFPDFFERPSPPLSGRSATERSRTPGQSRVSPLPAEESRTLVAAFVPRRPGSLQDITPGEDCHNRRIVGDGAHHMAVLGQRPRRPRLALFEPF